MLICIYIYIYMWICIYIYIYVDMYIYIYIMHTVIPQSEVQTHVHHCTSLYICTYIKKQPPFQSVGLPSQHFYALFVGITHPLLRVVLWELPPPLCPTFPMQFIECVVSPCRLTDSQKPSVLIYIYIRHQIIKSPMIILVQMFIYVHTCSYQMTYWC